jgi:succinate dehydrogenase hydrophobic anchor subunit
MATTKPRTLPLSKRGLTFEMFMWLFTRLSALGMYGLILIAIIGALIMGARNDMNFADVMRWGFMPNNTHVQSTNVPDLAPWSTPFWKLTASALLLVATAHGVHGLVVIADDCIVTARGRHIVRLWSLIR